MTTRLDEDLRSALRPLLTDQAAVVDADPVGAVNQRIARRRHRRLGAAGALVAVVAVSAIVATRTLGETDTLDVITPPPGTVATTTCPTTTGTPASGSAEEQIRGYIESGWAPLGEDPRKGGAPYGYIKVTPLGVEPTIVAPGDAVPVYDAPNGVIVAYSIQDYGIVDKDRYESGDFTLDEIRQEQQQRNRTPIGRSC